MGASPDLVSKKKRSDSSEGAESKKCREMDDHIVKELKGFNSRFDHVLTLKDFDNLKHSIRAQVSEHAREIVKNRSEIGKMQN